MSAAQPQPSPEALAAELRVVGETAGLAAVGFAPAAPMGEVRAVLEERKAAGLHAGMQFTYRNPARSTDPSRALAGAASLVVGAWPYAGGELRAGEGAGPSGEGAAPAGTTGRPQGRVARYARDDHYRSLREALGALADTLTRYGWKSRVLADDNALVDRAAAQRAGLGWFGKNTNVLLPGRGSWFVLGSVVTDAVVPYGPVVSPGCGRCRRCLGSCPTGALVAPGVLDARRCLAWLVQAEGVFPREHRVALGDRIYGCDDCQEVCPPNLSANRWSPVRLAPRPTTPAASAPVTGASVDLLDILSAPDEDLMDRFGRWYIPRRQPRYLRRNALLALGNSGCGGSEEVAEALRRYLSDDDDLLRAHAVWAALRLGRADLVKAAGMAGDTSPLVQAELAAASEVPAAGGG